MYLLWINNNNWKKLMTENMSKKQFITSVFEYESGAEFPSKLTEAFASDNQGFQDVKITALSNEDEMSRVEELEDQLNS